MNLPPLTRDQVREIDRRAVQQYGMPSLLLMENAGRGAADLLERLGIHGPVVICAGKGNNGGDGFVVARHLDGRGYAVRILLFADPATLQGDAAINYHIVQQSGIPLDAIPDIADQTRLRSKLSGAAWVVDALLGTGLKGPVRSPYGEVIEALNSSGTPIVAIDLPSGLDCDEGRPLGATVRAAHTATFVSPKKGFGAPGAAQYTGTVHVVDLGIPRRLLEAYLHV